MPGAMQDFELRIPRILDHAEREHGARVVASAWADGRVTRTDWAGVARESRRLARALERMGIRPGDRVATLAMNHHHHLIAWYGVIGMGGIVHTVNPRLFDDQLAYIVGHAEDRVLFYDRVFAPIVERLRPRWPSVEHYVCLDDGAFADLLAAHDDDYRWVEGPERDPCMLCYTSGTTGNPKGVLYEHRTCVLQAMAEIAPACFDLSPRAVVLPIVPMFHAAAWGMPFATAMAGVKLVYAAVNAPDVLCRLMSEEGVTHSAGVPTVWLSMFQHMDETGQRPEHLRLVAIGGSAAPRAMVERLMRMGIRVSHAWGMTETSPVGTMGSPTPDWDDLSFERKVGITTRQGRAPFGVELRTVDDAGRVLPRDGASAGRLQVRGAWVIRRYYRDESGDCIDSEGWFDTGDVAILHPCGTLQITDRAKDVIKSGGEWISSVELENAAVGCPGVAEAAAIGIAHPKWAERPLLLVVRAPGSGVTAGDVRAHLARHVAKWWLPDEILFVDSLPHTASGKLLKTALREQYRDHRLPG